MNVCLEPARRVLAIDPASRGFGFVVLESPNRLIDWGGRQTTGDKTSQTLAAVSRMIERYRPEFLILENCQSPESRRWERVTALIDDLIKLAESKYIKPILIPRRAIGPTLLQASSSGTKYEIAYAVSQSLPVLPLRQPRHRKAWMSEDYRMSIFDAAALALTAVHLILKQ